MAYVLVAFCVANYLNNYNDNCLPVLSVALSSVAWQAIASNLLYTSGIQLSV